MYTIEKSNDRVKWWKLLILQQRKTNWKSYVSSSPPSSSRWKVCYHTTGYLGHGIDISLLLPSTVDRLGAFWRWLISGASGRPKRSGDDGPCRRLLGNPDRVGWRSCSLKTLPVPQCPAIAGTCCWPRWPSCNPIGWQFRILFGGRWN